MTKAERALIAKMKSEPYSFSIDEYAGRIEALVFSVVFNVHQDAVDDFVRLIDLIEKLVEAATDEAPNGLGDLFDGIRRYTFLRCNRGNDAFNEWVKSLEVKP